MKEVVIYPYTKFTTSSLVSISKNSNTHGRRRCTASSPNLRETPGSFTRVIRQLSIVLQPLLTDPVAPREDFLPSPLFSFLPPKFVPLPSRSLIVQRVVMKPMISPSSPGPKMGLSPAGLELVKWAKKSSI